jgi:hypothetical protein
MISKSCRITIGMIVTIFVLTNLYGCTTYREKTTTTTETSPGYESEGAVTGSPTSEPPVRSTTIETDTETTSHSHGLIGGFFHFLGDVVAFPFRLIGGVFDAIF